MTHTADAETCPQCQEPDDDDANNRTDEQGAGFALEPTEPPPALQMPLFGSGTD